MASRHVRLRVLSGLGLAALTVLAGCYGYVPRSSATSIRAGRVVRIELTDSGVVALTSQVGPGVYRLEGKLTSATDSAVTIAASTLTSRRTNVEQFWNGEPITIPRSAIELLQERSLSKSRTAGFVALALGAVIGTVVAFDASGYGSAGGGRGGGKGQ